MSTRFCPRVRGWLRVQHAARLDELGMPPHRSERSRVHFIRTLTHERAAFYSQHLSERAEASEGCSCCLSLHDCRLLPFMNMSEDSENEYFGVIEELISVLAGRHP